MLDEAYIAPEQGRRHEHGCDQRHLATLPVRGCDGKGLSVLDGALEDDRRIELRPTHPLDEDR